MRRQISKFTISFRLSLVRLLTPVAFSNWTRKCNAFDYYIYSVPRPMIVSLKKDKDLVGVEIGVAEGINALSILNELSMKRLYLVDPYDPYSENGICHDHSEEKSIAEKRLAGYSQVTFITKTSKEALSDVPDDLDFVYIDGNHDYESVKQDIGLYIHKVKIGGCIGGHDYITHLYEGVTSAVDEFAETNDYRKNVDFWTILPDWWVCVK